MTGCSPRLLCNVVYALLMERADAGDSFATPLLLASGAKPEAVEAARRRDEIDTWLTGPVGQDAEAEEALVSWLKG